MWACPKNDIRILVFSRFSAKIYVYFYECLARNFYIRIFVKYSISEKYTYINLRSRVYFFKKNIRIFPKFTEF